MPTYEGLYADFDSELMRDIRGEAYGKDIGQYSWVTAEEMDSALARLDLTSRSRLLDIGCGPGGPLAFAVERTGASAVGLDFSAEAVEAARRRVPDTVSIQRHDANLQLPFNAGAFDAVMSIDAVLHIRNRSELFREVARVLVPGGRFWFTDAAVVAGPLSNAEVAARAPLGFTLFVPSGYNETELRAAGFAQVQVEDRTENVVGNASGRIAARLRHRAELTAIEGDEEFESQQRYLGAVIDLARRRVLRRLSYMAVIT